MAAQNVLPRVLIVSRRTVRKNKFVDFVGEYHLDLIVRYGGVPVIVPRVSGVHSLLDSFEPIHGVLLCEGEDMDPSWYEGGDETSSTTTTSLSAEELEEIRRAHASDTAIDKEKDTIELRLAKLCLERNIPYLGICRGSQVLNVASGGTLYMDVGKELQKSSSVLDDVVMHINYENYDGHRHSVKVVENTPLHHWFKGSLEEDEEEEEEGKKKMELWVNSYHHQGVKRLAGRFVPMAFAPDGLIEGFYDPDSYNPEDGKFIMGLQFHPERMRKLNSDEFDYPGCPFAYQEFVKAVVAYQKKQMMKNSMVPKAVKPSQEISEKKKKIIVRSFSLARNIYKKGQEDTTRVRNHYYPELQEGAEFLESNMGIIALTMEEESRLKEMGATVRNASLYFQRLRMQEEDREALARKLMGKMTLEQLSELTSFYHTMVQISSEFLFNKNPKSDHSQRQQQ